MAERSPPTQQNENSEDEESSTAQQSADRTLLSGERTYNSWVRTGLASLAAGLGVSKLLAGTIPDWVGLAIGIVLILYSVFAFVAGVWRELSPAVKPRQANIRRLPPLLLIFANSLLIVLAVIALIGIL